MVVLLLNLMVGQAEAACTGYLVTDVDGVTHGVANALGFQLHPASPSGMGVPGVIEIFRALATTVSSDPMCGAVTITDIVFGFTAEDNRGTAWPTGVTNVLVVNKLTGARLATIGNPSCTVSGSVYTCEFDALSSSIMVFAGVARHLGFVIDARGASASYGDAVTGYTATVTWNDVYPESLTQAFSIPGYEILF